MCSSCSFHAFKNTPSQQLFLVITNYILILELSCSIKSISNIAITTQYYKLVNTLPFLWASCIAFPGCLSTPFPQVPYCNPNRLMNPKNSETLTGLVCRWAHRHPTRLTELSIVVPEIVMEKKLLKPQKINFRAWKGV